MQYRVDVICSTAEYRNGVGIESNRALSSSHDNNTYLLLRGTCGSKMSNTGFTSK